MATITPRRIQMAEEATKDMVQDATPKKAMFMNRPYSQEERVKRDEEELARLVEEQKGTGETSEEETPSEEEPTNAEEKTFKKRYGDLRRHTQDKEKQFQKQLDDMKWYDFVESAWGDESKNTN